MTSGNNFYTLNNQVLFPSKIAEKPFSDEREQYFTPSPIAQKKLQKIMAVRTTAD